MHSATASIEETSQKIALLNDQCRSAMGIACSLFQTAGIAALSEGLQSRIREAVETYDAFDDDNDPWGEHDFGSFWIRGGASKEVIYDKKPDGGGWKRVFWKIDYYDKAVRYGSPDPANPRVTTRLLTIVLAEEY
ncbi:MAG: DUF3768 domain-containing protein [Geminicoccaceae bacterium]